jgi:O-antigen ligase
MTISEITSYLIWFEVINPFKTATVLNPTPFMSHISYNPFLAFAIYLLLHEVFFSSSINSVVRSVYSFFAITMSINMFITGGRAGQVVFFVMVALLFFQYFQKKIVSLVFSIVVVSGIFFTAYQSSELFQIRAAQVVNEAVNPSVWKSSSVGERAIFAIHSWEIFKESPVIGVGTGDFPSEYKKVNAVSSMPSHTNTVHPHNMYILVLTQLGILGLISFLSIFYFQLQFAKVNKSTFLKNTGIALPILFLVIMLSDSYLLGHFTTFLFVFFSSFLYKDFASK